MCEVRRELQKTEALQSTLEALPAVAPAAASASELSSALLGGARAWRSGDDRLGGAAADVIARTPTPPDQTVELRVLGDIDLRHGGYLAAVDSTIAVPLGAPAAQAHAAGDEELSTLCERVSGRLTADRMADPMRERSAP